MTQYELVFNGKLVDGFDPAEVKQNVAKLFKANSAQVEQMFSGKSVVLRNRLDAATAKKYRAILHKNGAACVIKEMDDNDSAGDSVESKTAVSSPGTKSPGVKKAITARTNAGSVAPKARSSMKKPVKTAGGLPIAGEKVDDILSEVDWDVAPVGTRLKDENEDIPLPETDTSHISIAPVGSDMGQKKSGPPPPAPDTSHLKLD